jgi:hypothetical protein
VIELMRVKQFVLKRQESVGWVLMALVLGTLALDSVGGFGASPRLLTLRAVYALEMLLVVGYLYTLSTAQPRTSETPSS